MNDNKILYLIIPNWRKNVNFIKTYYKKHQISIFMENVNNSKITNILKRC